MRDKLYVLICSSFLMIPAVEAQQLNPDFFYIDKGHPVARGIQVGDPSNWSTSIENRNGKSKSGKLTVGTTTFQQDGDALQLTWAPRKKVQGSFSVYGNAIDLSKYKDAASLTIDMRVDVKPDKDVKVGMDCGYPCRAEVQIRKMISAMPRGEWFSLPIPLNCFKSDNFDLSKINGPFSITTDGKFTVSIANVRLEKLPAGEKGCAEEE
ncbi:putative glycoside hydrolase [Cellvibrio japonicus]|nr:putative glycoside hydrolase [Cellvibrio japonicus]QEI13368.1 glucan-glucohydrolase [Cellvibrio japonicus]QEI16942.1 glucan-glucohydrolase [Cellvibrio japonicus]QEI20520.1 glucan-glucohydrolase [Cellvibrio japonicus]